MRHFLLTLAVGSIIGGCCACPTPSPVNPPGAGTVVPILPVPTAIRTLPAPLPSVQVTVPERVRPTITLIAPPATVVTAVPGTPTLEGQP